MRYPIVSASALAKALIMALVIAALLFAFAPGYTAASATAGEQSPAPDLSLPNIGLKKPADMGWPGGEALAYEYEAEVSSAFTGFPGGTKITFLTENEPQQSGGKMQDKLLMSLTHGKIWINSWMNFSAEYNPAHKAKAIEFSIGTKMGGAVPMQMRGKIPEDLISYRGELRDGKFIEDTKPPQGVRMKGSHSEKEAPADGFFFCGAGSTPGLTALMLSALDIEDGKQATVWIIVPDLPQAGADEEPPGFYRVNVCRLDKCNESIRQVWNDRRELFKNWTPPEDVKIYALYDEPYNPDDPDPVGFAYIDADGRLVRSEETSKGKPLVVVLKKVQGPEKAWWGKGPAK